MGNDKKNPEEEKGFVVKDRRFSAKKEEKPVPQAKQEGEPEESLDRRQPLEKNPSLTKGPCL